MVYYYVGGTVVLILLYVLSKLRKPAPPSYLYLRRTEMNVNAVWVKSVSPNVVKQTLTYHWDGIDPVNVELGPDVESFTILDVPAVHITVAVTASTAFKTSNAVVAEVDVPDMSVPEAPTGLTLSVE
jgi:hypothetical protein